MKTQFISIIAIMLFSHKISFAQNTTNIPVSMYGLGELVATEGGKYAGIGNAGVALNKNGFLNTLNPACISNIDTTAFTFDTGLTATYGRYQMSGESSSAETGNPNRISFALRMMPRWYMMIGAAPYSSVGYLIKTIEPIEGTNGVQVSSSFRGNGGLYKLYLTNALKLTRQLSLGASIGMISGIVEETETQENAKVTMESEKRTFYCDFGLHYMLNKHWSVGAMYALPATLKQEVELTYSNSSTSNGVNKNLSAGKQYIPQHVGVGITYQSSKWTFTCDYHWVQWSCNQSSLSTVKYIDQHKGNLGTIFSIPSRKGQNVELMAGTGYSNSYVVLKRGKMHYWDCNLGISIPIGKTFIALGAGWRKQLNTRKDLMQEDRFLFSLNISYGERISRAKIY